MQSHVKSDLFVYIVFSFSLTVMARHYGRMSPYLPPVFPRKDGSQAEYWRQYRQRLKRYNPEKYQMTKFKNAMRMRKNRELARQRARAVKFTE
ncbi:hypothetical protein BaRGS_00027527 [Batillaria attramentaria]|uniref:Uncharacterized protein n=1 Tax=Batillaria attramentaria TaxID=370345 RepID=A0ABD0K1L7_9CAEN